LRSVLRVSDPEHARQLTRCATRGRDTGRLDDPGRALHLSVDGEWSFVQTLRHLVFAMDKGHGASSANGSIHSAAQ
jgi:hypothetical protein